MKIKNLIITATLFCASITSALCASNEILILNEREFLHLTKDPNRPSPNHPIVSLVGEASHIVATDTHTLGVHEAISSGRGLGQIRFRVNKSVRLQSNTRTTKDWSSLLRALGYSKGKVMDTDGLIYSRVRLE